MSAIVLVPVQWNTRHMCRVNPLRNPDTLQEMAERSAYPINYSKPCSASTRSFSPRGWPRGPCSTITIRNPSGEA